MRPRKQVLIRCADRECRAVYRCCLNVWGYQPAGALDLDRRTLRCVLMDGKSADQVSDERIQRPTVGIVVITPAQANVAMYLEHGADVVLARDMLKRDLPRALRTALEDLTRGQRGPKVFQRSLTLVLRARDRQEKLQAELEQEKQPLRRAA